MTNLAALLAAPATRLADVQAHLAALAGQERVRQCRALGRNKMIRLYDLAEGAPPVAPDEMVSGAGEGETVRYFGKNSLPLFANFQKWFARQEGSVVGFNRNWHGFASGAGYFTLGVVDDPRGALLFDYTRTPSSAPAGWPRPRPNETDLPFGRFIYGNLHDYGRRVTDGVIVAKADRAGQYFLLCRS
jgi:hypothetical protein